jgi:AbrB family looped-hinge helix DNA binding protein
MFISIDQERENMDTVTISSKYQKVIPRAIHEKWNIKPGQKVRLIVYGNALEVSLCATSGKRAVF